MSFSPDAKMGSRVKEKKQHFVLAWPLVKMRRVLGRGPGGRGPNSAAPHQQQIAKYYFSTHIRVPYFCMLLFWWSCSCLSAIPRSFQIVLMLVILPDGPSGFAIVSRILFPAHTRRVCRCVCVARLSGFRAEMLPKWAHCLSAARVCVCVCVNEFRRVGLRRV